VNDKVRVRFKCSSCDNSGIVLAERELVSYDEVSGAVTLPCPTCQRAAKGYVDMTVPPRDDDAQAVLANDAQAVLEAWPEVRRLVLRLVGENGNIYDSDAIARLRQLVEALPEAW
jgi:hypothetical protein